MFNWMLGQLRKAVGRSSVRGKALNLNRLSSTRKNQKPRPQPNSVTRAIPSHVYVQLDARPLVERLLPEMGCSVQPKAYSPTSYPSGRKALPPALHLKPLNFRVNN